MTSAALSADRRTTFWATYDGGIWQADARCPAVSRPRLLPQQAGGAAVTGLALGHRGLAGARAMRLCLLACRAPVATTPCYFCVFRACCKVETIAVRGFKVCSGPEGLAGGRPPGPARWGEETRGQEQVATWCELLLPPHVFSHIKSLQKSVGAIKCVLGKL